MGERTLTISSAGKTFSFTGWKIGWACGPAELVAAVRTAKQFLTYVNGAPVPAGGGGRPRAAATTYFDDLATGCGRGATCCAPGWPRPASTVHPPAGTYFVTVDIAPLGEEDGVAFCRALPERCGVVGRPELGVLRRPRARAGTLVRFAFCKRTRGARRGGTPARARWPLTG